MKKSVPFGNRTRVLSSALIAILYLQMWYQPSLGNPVCNTTGCRQLGEYYKKNMNLQVNPCVDFYDYVCHFWGTQNPRPKYKSLWNVQILLRQRTIQHLRELLENERLDNGATFEHAKVLYRACMNLPYMEKADAATVKNVMAGIGNWPMFPAKAFPTKNIPWWEIESYYIGKTGESSILEFYLTADTNMNSEITLYVSDATPRMFPPSSPYGILKLSEPLDIKHKQKYKAFLTSILNDIVSINTKTLTKTIEEDLDAVINFREQVAEISKTRFTVNGSRLMKTEDFQEWYNNRNSGQDTAKINWLTMFRSMYQNSKEPSRAIVQPKTNIIVELFYFPKLAQILGKTPKRVIENHVHLYFAERHLKLNTQMEDYLENNFAANAARYKPPKWEKCVTTHNLEMMLGRAYVNAHFPTQSRREVQELLKEEIQQLKIKIFRSSWLDANIKNRSMKKLDNIRSEIGFPEWYNTISANVPRLIPEIDPTMPVAYYLPHFNSVSASASYLQWPNFMPNMPYVIKYGSTGVGLAHELHHSFDYTGLRYDETGYKQLWWPQDKLNLFHGKVLSLQTKYNKYRQEELRKRNVTVAINQKKIDSSVGAQTNVGTMEEDMADVMALQISYMAYKQELHKWNGTCPILPGFEKYGCEKLFFIAFANLFCEDSTPLMDKEILLSGTHSSPQIRTNGAVGNMKEFQFAFGCNSSDSFVSREVWDLWK